MKVYIVTMRDIESHKNLAVFSTFQQASDCSYILEKEYDYTHGGAEFDVEEFDVDAHLLDQEKPSVSQEGIA